MQLAPGFTPRPQPPKTSWRWCVTWLWLGVVSACQTSIAIVASRCCFAALMAISSPVPPASWSKATFARSAMGEGQKNYSSGKAGRACRVGLACLNITSVVVRLFTGAVSMAMSGWLRPVRFG
ncbi:hypothetical protein CV_1236 [Chromobacterium violaceum ATCC 12472]|uniref:Uncharacterized protein n=1 Tax=Chromobacterium violaceum (strain ATCC 12472 / DSM 30191 / JCM 1249 / CCUG 213 / NBRC 12614 / NCIMB 9131 / NCTC 9757 / MK) TaxID=243365 RepID=Q7NYN7_CHRVO|nr:hypothetical protein CV_1236 [Chromobacterium violaceum ATCC 12472]